MKEKDVYTCKDLDCWKNCNGFCISHENEDCKRKGFDKKEYLKES